MDDVRKSREVDASKTGCERLQYAEAASALRPKTTKKDLKRAQTLAASSRQDWDDQCAGEYRGRVTMRCGFLRLVGS